MLLCASKCSGVGTELQCIISVPAVAFMQFTGVRPAIRVRNQQLQEEFVSHEPRSYCRE